jgi:putative addiction module killer protein
MQPSSSFEIIEYVDSSGGSPFRHWFDALDAVVAARVTAALARLALGNWSRAKSVGDGVQELRLDFGPGYRVYFGVQGRRVVVLLGGGTKRRQQADIVRARQAWGSFQQHGFRGVRKWH